MQKILETENLTKKYKNGRGIENINLNRYEEWKYQNRMAVSETWEYQQ